MSWITAIRKEVKIPIWNTPVSLFTVDTRDDCCVCRKSFVGLRRIFIWKARVFCSEGCVIRGRKGPGG